jgi:hypothetical protein
LNPLGQRSAAPQELQVPGTGFRSSSMARASRRCCGTSARPDTESTFNCFLLLLRKYRARLLNACLASCRNLIGAALAGCSGIGFGGARSQSCRWTRTAPRFDAPPRTNRTAKVKTPRGSAIATRAQPK